MRTVALILVLCATLAVPAASASPSREQRQPLIGRLLRSAQATFQRWNRVPTREQSLRPLRRMIESGRISGSDLDRVRALYPELRGPRPEPDPLQRLLRSGHFSLVD